jgi:hypothetical protein
MRKELAPIGILTKRVTPPGSFLQFLIMAATAEEQEPAVLHPFSCPFSGCPRAYTRKDKLKAHLRTSQNAYDERHPADAAEWQYPDVKSLLVLYTRPKDLTSAEVQARKKASWKRCNDKNGDMYKQRQQQSRAASRRALTILQKLQAIPQMTDSEQFTTLLLQSAEPDKPVLTNLFSEAPDINTWLPINSVGACTVNDETFPRFVTYYLAQNEWPFQETIDDDVDDDNTDAPPILSVMPGQREYRKLSLLLHSDKGVPDIREGSQTLLNEAWNIWKVTVTDKELEGCPLFSTPAFEDFCNQSDIHKRVGELYFTWTGVVDLAKQMLLPSRLRPWDLEKAFARMDSVVNSGDRESIGTFCF